MLEPLQVCLLREADQPWAFNVLDLLEDKLTSIYSWLQKSWNELISHLINGARYEAADGFVVAKHVREGGRKAWSCLHSGEAHLPNVGVKAEAKDGLPRAHCHRPAHASQGIGVVESELPSCTGPLMSSHAHYLIMKRSRWGAHADISMAFR